MLSKIIELLNYYNITFETLYNLTVKFSKDEILNDKELKIVVDYYKLENSLKEKEKISKHLQWIDEWYDLFPAGVKTGGRHYVKSSKNSCETKLLKFIREYKYEKDVIIQATKNYLDNAAKNNYEYMSTAPHFIYKFDNSILSGYCEEVLNKNKENYVENDVYVDVNNIEEA
jgi:hypothetical protein